MIKKNNRPVRKDPESQKSGKRAINIHKAIEQIALDLSEKNGRMTGKDSGDWLEAERIVEKWQKDKSGR